MKKTILHLCASQYGSDSKPYEENGYNVIRITKEIGVENYHAPDNVYGIIANPPCTMFSKARTNAKTKRDLREGMRTVQECLRIIWEAQEKIKRDTNPEMPLKFWVLENPNAYLKWFLGKPAYIYSPDQFGDTRKKPTALWGVFNEPIRPILGNFVKSSATKPTGGKNRSDLRSITSPYFTEAFFLANQ